MRLPSGDGFTVHVATDADAPAICALFRDVHLPGDLDVNLERDPDPFALLRLHGGVPIPLIVRARGEPVACASVTVRDGWLDGARVRTGYLGDLRVRPGFRGGAKLARLYQPVLDAVREAHGAEVFTTVVFDGNAVARAALTGRGAARRGQPVYRPMTPFSMAAVQFVLPKRAPRRDVAPATDRDLDALVAFVDRRNRERVLGEDLSGERFIERLRTWPGLSLDDVLIARDGRGRIVGCVAPWDSAPVKRTRVLGYHGRFRWVKRGLDVGAALLRFPPLPAPGDCFRYAWLTHLEVEDDDPGVFNDLLRAATRRLASRRLHFLAAMVPTGSRLREGLRGFFVQDTPMTLYAVHARGGDAEARDWRTTRPGFEMALS